MNKNKERSNKMGHKWQCIKYLAGLKSTLTLDEDSAKEKQYTKKELRKMHKQMVDNIFIEGQMKKSQEGK